MHVTNHVHIVQRYSITSFFMWFKKCYHQPKDECFMNVSRFFSIHVSVCPSLHSSCHLFLVCLPQINGWQENAWIHHANTISLLSEVMSKIKQQQSSSVNCCKEALVESLAIWLQACYNKIGLQQFFWMDVQGFGMNDCCSRVFEASFLIWMHLKLNTGTDESKAISLRKFY